MSKFRNTVFRLVLAGTCLILFTVCENESSKDTKYSTLENSSVNQEEEDENSEVGVFIICKLDRAQSIFENACVILKYSDGRVVRASASGAVDSGLIPSRVKPMTLKLVFTATLLDAQH